MKLPPTPMEKAPDPELGTAPIPVERYTSVDFMQPEWDGMWLRVWLMAGRESDIPEPGDYFTFDVGRESVLVVRQRDGNIVARHNVCMHRGNRLCASGRGHVRRFLCRFHGWAYDIDGSLAHVTDRECFPQGLPEEKLHLAELRCDTWGGFVFVSFDPDAEPLHDFLGVIPRHLDPYHMEECSILNDITLEIDCNWKTCVDAFNEAYHVQATHPGLMQYSDDVNVQIDCYDRHTRFLYPLAVVSPRLANHGEITEPIRELFLRGAGIDPDEFEGSAADVRSAIAKSMRTVMGPAMGVDFSELNDDQLIDDYHYTIFPNITFNIHARGVWVFRHRPHPSDPNKMYFDIINMLRAPGSRIERPPHEQHRAGEYALAKAMGGGDVLDEDVANLPGIQAGMNSRCYEGLFLGTQELRIRHWHSVLDRYLTKPDPGSEA